MNQERELNVCIFDDGSEEIINLLAKMTENVKFLNLDEFVSQQGVFLNDKFIKAIFDCLDVVFLDAGYVYGRISALNIYDQVRKNCPQVAVKLMVGEDVEKYLDKYSKQYSELMIKRMPTVYRSSRGEGIVLVARC